MPITKSAKKALRQSLRKRQVNLLVRKKFKEAVKQTRKKPTPTSFKKAAKALDRAAKKKVIHKNKADQRKQPRANGHLKTSDRPRNISHHG